MPNLLLRVRNLKTNFYTYAGVVQALEGVSFDMWEGETLGLVGETGCGKSVSALSILRLIPQPPGKIEEGEALFDLPPEVAAQVDEIEARVYALLPKIVGEGPESRPDDLSVRRLQRLVDGLRARTKVAPADAAAFRKEAANLMRLKEPYDLLLKSDAEMREIRGDQIAMIFQEPMQALNPVFPIGDQIAENILLHQRDTVVRSLVERMEIEEERDALGAALNRADATGRAAGRSLPADQPRPRAVNLFLHAWAALSAASLALFSILALGGSTFGAAVGVGGVILAFFAAIELVTTYGLLDLRPWTRPIGLAVALLDLIARIPGLILSYADWFKLFLLVGMAFDGVALLQFTKAEVAQILVGRARGWAALLRNAEADLASLSDIGDAIARSSWPESQREAFQADLDRLVARVRHTLDSSQKVTGSFHPLLPRRVQLLMFRRMRGWFSDEVLPELRAAFEGTKPLPFDPKASEWRISGPRELLVTLPKGAKPDAAVAALQGILRANRQAALRTARRPLGAAMTVTTIGSPAVDRPVVRVRIRDPGRAVGFRVLRRIPLVRRAVERPVYDEAVRRSIQILRQVKISDPERIAGQYPYELSGGMQQRSLIAIALSCNPRLLVADEPTTALDVTIQAQILDLIREMKRQFGSSVLIITHDLGIIAEMCNRVCVMYAGHIVEDAAVRAVFKAPLHPYTQGLMKAVPTHTVRKEVLEIIRGSVPNLIYPPPGCRFHPRCPVARPNCGWSPKEVGESLLGLLREVASREPAPPFDLEALGWEPEGTTVLRIVPPEGASLDAVTLAIRRAIEEGRSRAAIQAITAIEPRREPSVLETVQGKRRRRRTVPAHVLVRIIEPHRPPYYLPEPRHMVACVLYAESGVAPLVGGARAGR